MWKFHTSPCCGERRGPSPSRRAGAAAEGSGIYLVPFLKKGGLSPCGSRARGVLGGRSCGFRGAGGRGQRVIRESESLSHLGSAMKFDWTPRLGKDHKSEEVPILSSRQWEPLKVAGVETGSHGLKTALGSTKHLKSP